MSPYVVAGRAGANAALRVALLAADRALIAQRVGSALDTLALADVYDVRTGLREDGYHPAFIGGIVPTNVTDQAAQRHGLADLRTEFPGLVTAPIPHSPYVERAANRGMPVTLAYPDTPAARAYTALAHQLL